MMQYVIHLYPRDIPQPPDRVPWNQMPWNQVHPPSPTAMQIHTPLSYQQGLDYHPMQPQMDRMAMHFQPSCSGTLYQHPPQDLKAKYQTPNMLESKHHITQYTRSLWRSPDWSVPLGPFTPAPISCQPGVAHQEYATGWLFSQLKQESWKTKLKPELCEDYMKNIEIVLDKEYKEKQIFPPKNLIFNAFNLTPFDEVKVVILGQDPYPGVGKAPVLTLQRTIRTTSHPKAMGLAFSVPVDMISVPDSLRNIYTELETDIPGFERPDHGCLVSWAKHGVLLLNTTLTVEGRADGANSHAKYGWQIFTDYVIGLLGWEREKIVFILMGKDAHKKEMLINASKHCVIKTAHPSPQSWSKFRGCKCFSMANWALEAFGKTSIDWTVWNP